MSETPRKNKRQRSSPPKQVAADSTPKERHQEAVIKHREGLKERKKQVCTAAGRTNWSAALGKWREKVLGNLRDSKLGFAVVPKDVGLVNIDRNFKASKNWNFPWSADTCIFNHFDADQEAEEREQTRHQHGLKKPHMKLLNTENLEAFMASFDLHTLGYTCLYSCPGKNGAGTNQKVHTDWRPQNSAYNTRLGYGEHSGPVSTITAMSREGAWLDIWWLRDTKPPPRHPKDPPSFRIFIEYGDTLIFRHDLWHSGTGYERDNYRMFSYFQAEDKYIPIVTGKEGETHSATCLCKTAAKCTCMPRTTPAKCELRPGSTLWEKVCCRPT